MKNFCRQRGVECHIVKGNLRNARIAQLVEQGTENPCVAGSNPAPGTTIFYE